MTPCFKKIIEYTLEFDPRNISIKENDVMLKKILLNTSILPSLILEIYQLKKMTLCLKNIVEYTPEFDPQNISIKENDTMFKKILLNILPSSILEKLGICSYISILLYFKNDLNTLIKFFKF